MFLIYICDMKFVKYLCVAFLIRMDKFHGWKIGNLSGGSQLCFVWYMVQN